MPNSRAARRNRDRIRRHRKRGNLPAYTVYQPTRKRYKAIEWYRTRVNIESEEA
jgi:hypothetical protein